MHAQTRCLRVSLACPMTARHLVSLMWLKEEQSDSDAPPPALDCAWEGLHFPHAPAACAGQQHVATSLRVQSSGCGVQTNFMAVSVHGPMSDSALPCVLSHCWPHTCSVGDNTKVVMLLRMMVMRRTKTKTKTKRMRTTTRKQQ